MWIKTLLLLCLFGSICRADTAELPPVSTLDDLFEGFHAILKQKAGDLARNYYYILDPHGITFRSDKPVTCVGHGSAKVGEDIARIDHHKELNSETSELRETVRYRSCHNEVVFSEVVVTTGKDLIIPQTSAVLSGVRRISLASNENSRQYIVMDHLDRPIFQVSVQRYVGRIDAIFQMAGTEALYYRESRGEKKSEVSYRVKSFSFNFKGFARSVGYKVTGLYSNFVASATDESCCLYLINSPSPVSPKTFFENFSSSIMGLSIGALTQTVSALVSELPSTEIISSGVQSGRMLDELNVALSQVTAGTQLDQVKALILRYIEAFKLGQIVDDRPVVVK